MARTDTPRTDASDELRPLGRGSVALLVLSAVILVGGIVVYLLLP